MASRRNPKGRKAKAGRAQTRWPWQLLLAPALVAVAGVAFLVYVAIHVDSVSGNINREAETWQAAFWKKPIPPQGPAPATHLEPARGITPESCGVCHVFQYQEWKGSRHSMAMGPGVMGQFPTMEFADEASCLECHAPMSEQWKQVPGPDGRWAANAAYDPKLEGQGMSCAACHLRRHRRHGAPLPEGRPSVSQVVHGEPLRTPFFRASEFCKGCHQHPSTSLTINGKAVENTYQEWLQSPFAARGVTCQGCHMPEGRHLWRGIHDPGMTRSGVTIASEVSPATLTPGTSVKALLRLTNTGTGHAFPTYTTPAVFLKAAFLDGKGKVIKGDYYAERVLQRRLDMSVSPWGETSDTRLLPGRTAALEFARVVPPGAVSLHLWVWVEPDHFYTGFYQAYLKDGATFPGAKRLAQALKATRESPYLLFSRTIPVTPGPAQARAEERDRPPPAGPRPRTDAPPGLRPA